MNEGFEQNIDQQAKEEEISKENAEKEQSMLEAGAKMSEKVKESGFVNLNELASGDNLKMEIEPGTKLEVDLGRERIRLETKYALANKLGENKYLSILNGQLIVSDLDYTKNLIDERIKNSPEDLDDFKKSIESLEKNNKPLTGALQYIKESYLQEEHKETETGTEKISSNEEDTKQEKVVNLEKEKDEAVKDFLETLEAQELLLGENLPENEKKIQRRNYEINTRLNR
jgi:hypothetical protein